MKTKPSIYHNYKTFIYVLLASIIFYSCGSPSQPSQPYEVKSINSLGKFPYNVRIDELTVVQIDSCEYIVCNAYKMKDITITHKGNCIFCAERNKR